jgi:chemotaxis response regulator CheB
MTRRIRTLVVDDSALMRKLLTEVLTTDPGIEVVGTAGDPFVARDLIKQLAPDVLTLDVEMPRMDGLTFLRNLMRLRPMPVVMVSSLTEQSAEVTLAALELGAFDFVTKPKLDLAHGLSAVARDIVGKVKAAASSKPRTPAAAPGGAGGALARRGAHDRSAHRDRRVDWRHRSDRRGAARPAARLARRGDRAAHPAGVQPPIRRAPRSRQRAVGARGPRWRRDPGGPRLRGARGIATCGSCAPARAGSVG